MPLHPTIIPAAVLGVVAVLLLGCGTSETAVPAQPTSTEATSEPSTTPSAPPCSEGTGGQSDPPAAYETKGKELVGDVDWDGEGDRVTLRVDETRPESCRYLLVVELAAGSAVAPVTPLDWPGTNPELVLLAQIDGRSGLEPAIALSPMNVYEPGAIFTMRDGELARLRLGGRSHGELFPFDDEFPAGVDCAGEPGAIVVTFGGLADGGKDDRYWDIRRSFYRAADARFEPVRTDEFRVKVGRETPEQWPELRGDPFPSCPDRVD
jgi:hypothetical protein